MKRLIILLLLWPAFASAQGNGLSITKGSITLSEPLPAEGAFVDGSGPTSGGFSFTARMEFGTNGPGGISNAIPLGSSFVVLGANDSENNLSISLTVGGVPWQPPVEEMNFAIFQSKVGPITGAGTYSAPFDFGADFSAVPAPLPPPERCIDQCTTWFIGGFGTMVAHVVSAGPPNAFYIDKATLTFKAPEPSTTTLLLLGVAGLAVLGRRRGVSYRQLNN